MPSSMKDKRYRAADVGLADGTLRVWLRDGRTVTVPVAWFPRLRDAAHDERNNWKTVDDGTAIRWSGLDETISVRTLLADAPPFGPEGTYPGARNVEITDGTIRVWLHDGRTLTVPLRGFPRLCDGSPTERNNVEFSGDGSAVRWPDLDEDIHVDGILDGGRSRECATSLGRWLLARREGRSVMGYDLSAYEDARPRPVPLA